MGLLRKARRKLLKRLSSRKRQCKADIAIETPQQADTRCNVPSRVTEVELTQGETVPTATVRVTASAALQERAEIVDDACGGWSSEPVVNVTELSSDCNLEAGLRRAVAAADLKMLPAVGTGSGGFLGVRNLSSESDSGVCLGTESELQELEDEACEYDDGDFAWSDEECECECDECAFARCEDILEDWHISAKDLTLEKVVSSEQGEMVYSGYWHGSVTVHQRQSTQQSVLNFYINEAHTLSKIRHENVQLFLGVCLDLHADSVSLVMGDMKGDSLHTLLHKRGQEFTFSAMTKYINQIAQGMAYLHDRGIAHPLLTSSCISIHYRACISMLSPAFCSNSVEPSQLVYLPPEVIRTLQPTHVSPSARHHNSLSTHPANQDSTDANIFSFGTIVYEMVTMSRPFSSTPGELIIWEVGNNRCQSLHHMNSGKLKDLIQRCWSADAALRPSFKELLGTLEQNMSPRACGMNTYFSFSDPGRLDKAGLR